MKADIGAAPYIRGRKHSFVGSLGSIGFDVVDLGRIGAPLDTTPPRERRDAEAGSEAFLDATPG
jgi:hypothetical protein